MLHLDAPSQPATVRVPDMFVQPRKGNNVWRESGSLQPPSLYPKPMLSVLPLGNDYTTDQSAGALDRKPDLITVPKSKSTSSELRPVPKVLVAWSSHHLLPPTTSSPTPHLVEPRSSITHDPTDSHLLDNGGHSCRDKAQARPMNGPERPIMTNGGGIGSEGRAWLNDVTAVVTATAANSNTPSLLRAPSSSLFRPPISLASTQDYSNTSSHLYSQFSPLHASPSYFPPPSGPPPSIPPYPYYPLQYPRGYAAAPASIIPRPFHQLDSYHSLTGMGSHPRSAFLPSQYSSNASPSETSSYSLMSPRATSYPVHMQYPEPEIHSPNKDTRHKTSSSLSPLAARHRSESQLPPVVVKSCSPKRELSPHVQDTPLQHISYKVPSGKEGSLKHRILTRPPDIHIEHSALSAERSPEFRDSSPKKQVVISPAATSTSMPSTPLRTTGTIWRTPPPPPMSAGATLLRYPAHFVKGSIIQLANGELKNVEELRTEDFVQSAELSADLKIDSSTVVRIEENADANTCSLGFSVGDQRVQVTVEAALEHPFFVFGQGWSSCLPDRTQQRYNLQCKKLQVGDVCISLTHKDQHSSAKPLGSVRQSGMSLVGSVKPVDGVIVPPQTHSIETQTQHSGGPMQVTSCLPNTAVFFPNQPTCLPRKRRWSAPDKVAEEFKPRTKLS